MENGRYAIVNTGRALMLDLQGNLAVADNPIIGFPLNGTNAQKWTITVLDAASGIISIRNDDNGGYFTTANGNVGESFVFTPDMRVFHIGAVAGQTNVYTIALPVPVNPPRVVSIPVGEDPDVPNFNVRLEQLQLHPEDLNPINLNQQWLFVPVEN
ncbi:hypothetical protein BDR04DRAFT_1104117 [Suillus decipiens]|nr:hypothetical protein BDR04DRAFT_1104117 [Suillus decipiens]